MINWTRCKDAMPDTGGQYLVCYEILGHQHISIAYISDDIFEVFDIQGDCYEIQDPTHWSELNKPLGVVTCTKQYTLGYVERLQETLKEHVFLNQSRKVFEELLLTRWQYYNDPDFEINEDTGEYEDELVRLAWIGYYLAWNKWSN